MDINQIKVLAAQGESQQLEYKKSTSNLKDILQTICAFLNGVIHHPKGTTDHHLMGPLNHHLNGAI